MLFFHETFINNRQSHKEHCAIFDSAHKIQSIYYNELQFNIYSCYTINIICKNRRRFTAALLSRLFGINIAGHITKAPQVGFKLATNCIQFYAVANFDKTSLMGECIWCETYICFLSS